MMEKLNEIDANEITERDNLAVILRVKGLTPIPNKDRIELVHLKDCGYTCVCEKRHKVDDLVLFVKYDSILPQLPMFEFMRETKFRIKSKSFTERDDKDVVINKIYSQGIILPLQLVIDHFLSENSIMYEHLVENVGALEGIDVTEALGVKKYIPPVVGSGSSFGQMQSKGEFPTNLVSKTDETNLASKINLLDEFKGKDVYITKKIEGSSITVTWDEDNDELMVCSRNNQIGEHETNKFWQAVNKYNLKDKLKEYPWLVIQGECYGEKIQSNHLKISGVDMAIFTMSDKRNRRRLSFDETANMNIILDTNLVPLIENGIIHNFNLSFDELQNIADSQYYDSGYECEGIVIRPMIEVYSTKLQAPLSVKVINRNYRL